MGGIKVVLRLKSDGDLGLADKNGKVTDKIRKVTDKFRISTDKIGKATDKFQLPKKEPGSSQSGLIFA